MSQRTSTTKQRRAKRKRQKQSRERRNSGQDAPDLQDDPKAQKITRLLETLDKEQPMSTAHDEAFVTLRNLAISSRGLVSHRLRRRAWPYLLGVGASQLRKGTGGEDEARKTKGVNVEEQKKLAHQIRQDVIRSLFSFQQCKEYTDRERQKKRAVLSALLLQIFAANPDLHYYQGFHDVCTVHLLVCGSRVAPSTIQRHSRFFLRDHHGPDFSETIASLELIFVLLKRFDPGMYLFLETAGMQPYFCLSWILTGFAHDITDLDIVARLFDVSIASHPMFPLYFSAAIVLHPRVRKGLLKLENEMPEIHGYLQKVPPVSLSRNCQPGEIYIEMLIRSAQRLMCMYPPKRLAQHLTGSKESVVWDTYPPYWYPKREERFWLPKMSIIEWIITNGWYAYDIRSVAYALLPIALAALTYWMSAAKPKAIGYE